ncbi:TonB-dependent receptor [Sphingomonadaceae bacterium jetA1]|jgi:iron complex outermembrane receptor protein|uniref:TonB-dependent receptor n=1 Tax=Facivitalis istanbulensis TaxID=3075838 RepID=UPI003474E24A
MSSIFVAVAAFVAAAPADASSVEHAAATAAEVNTDQRHREPEIIVVGQRDPAAPPPPYAGGQVASGARNGLLGNTDITKSPFSIASYTEQFMLDRQADTASEALALDPSVRATQGSGAPFDTFYIRGFPINEGTSGEIAFDGTFGVAPSFRIFTDYAERVEVLKGPSAAITGMSPNGGIGGTVNIVPKSAEGRLRRFTVDYGSALRFGAQADVAQRFGAGEAWGVRAIASVRDGNTPFDHQDEHSSVGALALDYRGSRLRASLHVVAQTDRFVAPLRPYFALAGVAIPDAPDGRRNPTQRWEYSHIDDYGVLARVDYKINDAITLFAAAGGRRSTVDRFFASARVIASSDGRTQTAPQLYEMDIDARVAEAGLRAKFDTGPIAHQFVVQANVYDEDTTRYLSAVAGAYGGNLYRPAPALYQAPVRRGDRPRLSDSTLKGVTVADVLSAWDETILLTIGARRQNIRANNYVANVGTLSAAYDRSATTPFVGLVVRPVRGISLYGNHVEGLSRGDVAPALASNAGEILAPYVARQIEAGMKFDFGRIGGSIGAFRITRQIGELAGGLYGQTGEQRVRGLELSTYGRITPRFGVVGGLTLLDAELTRTAVLANRGHRPIGVPEVQFNLGADWDVPLLAGLNVNAAAVHTASQFVDAANRQTLPAWTRFDLGVRQAVALGRQRMTLRAAVTNVTDRHYWTGVASFGTFFQGAPRTISLSAAFDL